MTQLISLENIYLAYGLYPLLDEVKLQINQGERICLIGRNGAGKSSLLKIIEGSIVPDAGTIVRKPNLKIAKLEQTLPQHSEETVYEYVASGLAQIGLWLKEYFQLTHQVSKQTSSVELKRLEKIQHELDVHEGWQYDQNIQTVLTRLQLTGDKKINTLSGGWQRRAALAKALVSNPDILLLDEPTNHLDIEAIEWLEKELLASQVTLVFITHDRALLQRLATRIIELDRGKLTSWPGDYENFVRRKNEMLHAEAKEYAHFDKKLAQEEIWIRQGIKARRTRNEGRVRALKAMREERSHRRLQEKTAQLKINTGLTSGEVIFELSNVSHSLSNVIVKNFSLRVMRGDRIGLVGANGVGKTTLLNILLGKMIPDEGIVLTGTKLQIAYFDQLRQQLDLNKTVMDNVASGKDSVEFNGKTQHIISYLSDFLFTPERSRTPVSALSGGECNRLLLAKLFSQPANVLVLDEPTNDLDIETLDLLEEMLMQFSGTILIVSHDRMFLENVVTSLLIFEGEGKIQSFVGGYQDWLTYKNKIAKDTIAIQKNKTDSKDTKEKLQTKSSTKLSYKEMQELNELPQQIESLENQLQALQATMNDPEFYKQDSTKIAETLSALKNLETQIQTAYQRWEALEAKQALLIGK